jgi:antitoxin ParD1/3/4
VFAVTTLNISLPDSLREFVESQAAKAGYGNPSEYVEAVLRERQKSAIRAELEAKLLEGVESGSAGEMTQKDWEDLRLELRRRTAERNNG